MSSLWLSLYLDDRLRRCENYQIFVGMKSPKIIGNFLSVSRTDKFKNLSVQPNICRSRTDEPTVFIFSVDCSFKDNNRNCILSFDPRRYGVGSKYLFTAYVNFANSNIFVAVCSARAIIPAYEMKLFKLLYTLIFNSYAC